MSKSKTSSSSSRSKTAPESGPLRTGGRGAKAFPIVVSGPSGAGKTTLVTALARKVPGLRRSVSVTTRPSREGEVEGEAYVFVDERRFRKLEREGELVEWAEVHGRRYGTPKAFVEAALDEGVDVVLTIDVQGARQVKKSFPDAVTVFILPPSFEVLEQRIRLRAADPVQDIEKRLDKARAEIGAVSEYDYVIVNDRLRDAVSALVAIVVAERSRRKRFSKGFFDRFK